MSSFIANVGLVGTVAIISTNVIMDPLTTWFTSNGVLTYLLLFCLYIVSPR